MLLLCIYFDLPLNTEETDLIDSTIAEFWLRVFSSSNVDWPLFKIKLRSVLANIDTTSLMRSSFSQFIAVVNEIYLTSTLVSSFWKYFISYSCYRCKWNINNSVGSVTLFRGANRSLRNHPCIFGPNIKANILVVFIWSTFIFIHSTDCNSHEFL